MDAFLGDAICCNFPKFDKKKWAEDDFSESCWCYVNHVFRGELAGKQQFLVQVKCDLLKIRCLSDMSEIRWAEMNRIL